MGEHFHKAVFPKELLVDKHNFALTAVTRVIAANHRGSLPPTGDPTQINQALYAVQGTHVSELDRVTS